MKKQKTKTGVICFIFSMTLLIYSCNSTNRVNSDEISTTTPQIISSNTPVSLTPYKTPTPTLQTTPFIVVSLLAEQEALEQMYGKDISIYSDGKAVVRTVTGNTYNVNINVFSCYHEWTTGEICLVITDRSHDGFGCHECGAHVDGAIFERNYRGWTLRLFRSNIAELGTFGHVPNAEIIPIGPEKYAAQFKWIYGNSDYIVEHLVIIAETENSLDVVLNIASRQEKWILPSGKIEYGWNTSLDFQLTDKSNEYYDLTVTYFGEMPYDTRDLPYSEFYTFTNGKYTLVPQKGN